MQATGLKKLCSCSEICHCSALPQLQSVSHAVGRKRWPMEDLSPLQFSQLEKFSESISNVKAFLIQIKPNPNNYALVLFVFFLPSCMPESSTDFCVAHFQKEPGEG